MPKVLVIYDSRTGNTEKMAVEIAGGAATTGVDVDLKKVDDANLDDLANADGVIIGCPDYFGSISDRMKVFIDKSTKVRSRMENKVGAAFCSAGVVGGGGDTTVIALIQAMLILGMIIVGDPQEATGHYGAVSIKAPDEKTLDTCHKLGKRVGQLVLRLDK